MRFVKRLGKPPHELGMTTSKDSCPDIWELDDGSFAVIGTDVTEQLAGRLPADVHCADYEKIVVVSRPTLVAAKNDIPER